MIHLPVHALFWALFPALALELPNPWVGASLFYALPLMGAFLVSRWFCRRTSGGWFISGSALVYLNLFFFQWDSHFRAGFGGCHSCSMGWIASATFLPVLIGQAWALWELRGRRQRVVDRELQ